MINPFKPLFLIGKSFFIFSLGLIILTTGSTCTPQLSPELAQIRPQIPVIPAPASIDKKPGKFRIIPGFRILSSTNNEDVRKIINSFAEKLRKIKGMDVPIIAGSKTDIRDNILVIELAPKNSHLGNEGYELEINPNSMFLFAYKPAGLFYGVLHQKIYQPSGCT